jgi:hypothetical protein
LGTVLQIFASKGRRKSSLKYVQSLPEVRNFTENVTSIALTLRRRLAKLDRMDKRSFGELLEASFPKYEDKSKRRFVNHYMYYQRTSDMALLGMMPELKLINLELDRNEIARIGLTKFGIQFALLKNPVIDQDKPESLSDEEVDFLLNHISGNIPAESEHMICALTAIDTGRRTRDELNSVLKEYYAKYFI